MNPVLFVRKWMFARISLLLPLVVGMAATNANAGNFGQEGFVKVRLPSPGLTSEVLLKGAQRIADYGSFVIVEMPATLAADVVDGQVLADENLILLNAAHIDTTLAASKQLQLPRGEFAGKTLHLIQFAGPIQPEWYRDLEATGVQVVTYIPSNTYLVYGDSSQLIRLQAMAALAPHVQWNGAYLDEYKMDPGVQARAIATNAVPEANLYAIQLVADTPANAATLAVIDQVKTAPIYNSYSMLEYFNVIVSLPPDKVAQIAKQPEVVSIQPYDIPVMLCERQDQIVAGNITFVSPNWVPTGPGYLAWLASKGFTQAQFTASAFSVDLSDSSVDKGTTSPNHFGLWAGGVIGSTSHVSYTRKVSGTTVTSPTDKGCDGHGNLNAHIIGGFDDSSGFPFADASGFHYGLGVCPFVKVGSSEIFDTSLAFTSPNYTTLQSNAYNSGARISSNSWGSQTSNLYTSDSQSYDALVRDAQPTGAPFPAAGNQEMVIVFANGNSGSGSGTVRSPATAKNVISVGAAEDVQLFGGTDASGVGDSGANSANDIISFSSRGPCPDGRKKPEIVAPDTHVSGGVVQANAVSGGTGAADACFTGAGVSGGTGGSHYWPNTGQQYYTASSGTSHSCPGVSGGCALVRQFFINQGMSAPSPAMTKALLMNSARFLNGTGANNTLWSNSQGMGEMNLGDAFDRGTGTLTIFKDEDTVNNLFTASGQTRTFTGLVADNSKPFKVTVAWTDAPGSTTGNAYRNDLNLTVSVGGNTYLGNVFDATLKNVSATGGSADAADNAESVFVAAGVSGSFTVTVTAANINSDGVPNVGTSTDQDFALVIYNATNCVAPVVNSISNTSTTCGVPFTSGTPSTSAGSGPITWSLGAGAPAGMTINSSTGVVSWPTPVTAGSPFTLTTIATNSCGNNSRSWTLIVAANPPSIATIPNDTTLCGVPYTSSAPSASGGVSPLTWSLVAGPGGMTINPSTGAVSWPNPVLTGSPHTVTVQASSANGCGTDSKTWSLTVNPNPPAISFIPDDSANCGIAYTSAAPSASGGVSPLTWSLMAGPSGMTIDSSTGAVGWPSPDPSGSPFTITVQAASIGDCGSDSKSWMLSVNGNQVSIDPIADAYAVCGAPYTSPAPSTTGGAPPFTWTLISGPSGMTIDSSTGAVSWTSPTAVGSPFAISVQATSSGSCGSSAPQNWQLGVVIGDFDQDGLLTEGDIPGFVNSLLDGNPVCAGDLNNDGFLDGLDIAAFDTALGL